MNTHLKILLIEDDIDDIELLEEALKSSHVIYSLDVVMEGDKVAAHMANMNDLPEVIVLDFNLPRMHGKEVLRMIKLSEQFSKIPLVVLTTSAAREDMDYALKMGAARFITKPTSIEGFANTVSGIIASVKRFNE